MAEEITIELVATVDQYEVALTEATQELAVSVTEVEQGPAGPPGPVSGSNITVSVSEPSNPAINDLWLQLPP